MVQGNAILVVDLGNSCTKCSVMFGKNAQTGKFREKRFNIPNVFAKVEPDYQVSSDYTEDTSTILSVDMEWNDIRLRGDFCNGELQEREMPASTIMPSAKMKKYNLDSSVLSYHMAFLYACKAIMQMTNVRDFNQLELSWTVVTLLPPGDIDVGKDKIKKLIESIKVVNAKFPQASIPIDVRAVHVLPEGFCAYVGVVFDKGNIFRPDYKHLTEETVLILDIGAGTTDCLVIKDNKLVQSSKYTVPKGGTNVFRLVMSKLRSEGNNFAENEVRNGIITGYVKDGAKKFDLTPLINQAKGEVAQAIISEFQGYIESTDLMMRSIGYVIVVGGGSLIGKDIEGMPTLSEDIIKSIKRQAVNCELVTIPSHNVQKEESDGDVRTVSEQISPRELNLIGATILAEAL